MITLEIGDDVPYLVVSLLAVIVFYFNYALLSFVVFLFMYYVFLIFVALSHCIMMGLF